MDVYELMVHALVLVIGSGLLVWLYEYASVLTRTRRVPGWTSAISVPMHPLRDAGLHVPFVFPANKMTLERPWEKFETARSDLLATTSFTSSHPCYVSAGPTTAKAIIDHPNEAPKPTWLWLFQAVNIYGENLVTTNSSIWKRHRDVVKACFSEQMNEAVWDCMAAAVDTMLDNCGISEEGGILSHVRDAMTRMTLLVIADKGFGLNMPWKYPEAVGNKTVSFEEALDVVLHHIMPIVLLPEIVLRFAPSASLRRAYAAKKALGKHLFRLAREKRNATVDAKELGDAPKSTQIFQSLINAQLQAEANAGNVKRVGLSEADVNGNMFILIMAGHETTSHALTFCLAYLCLNPDVQDKLAAHIAEQWPEGHTPSYRDYPALAYVRATIRESLRMRDSVLYAPKAAVEDVCVPYTTWDDQGNVTRHETVIEKGSMILFDQRAMHRNPYYWPEPDVFRPERFMDLDWEKDGFFAFSAGQRGCIGKKFAEVEMVCFLAHFIHRYRVSAIPAFDGETRDQMEKRLISAKEEVTILPDEWSMKLEKRL